MGLLDDIVAHKQAEIATLRSQRPRPRTGHPVCDVLAALRRPKGAPLRLITEIKFRSPSAGPLSRALTLTERARAYEQGGASMISVLTDARWFDGSYDDLRAARETVAVPLLCKDFVVHEVQIDHALAAGADAVLVIVRCLPNEETLRRLVDHARQVGLEPFVEVVDETETTRALAAGARLIGVNARDLDTLQMDAARTERVLASMPPEVVAVRLSGLKTARDATDIARSRADAGLIGEALMRCDDPRDLLAALQAGASEN